VSSSLRILEICLDERDTFVLLTLILALRQSSRTLGSQWTRVALTTLIKKDIPTELRLVLKR